MKKKKVLFIEDDKDLRDLLTIRLIKAGYIVSTAQDGQMGLDEIKDKVPDVVALDLMLPKIRGEDICRAVREDHDKRIARIPIIMMTAKLSDVDKVIGMVSGANRYLRKSFDSFAS